MGDASMGGPAKDRRRWRFRRYVVVSAVAAVGAAVSVGGASLASTPAGGETAASVAVSASHYRVVAPTATPIKHVVVLFDENVSFDHYFGTYPNAANTDGTPFSAKARTPKVNGLTPQLLTANPNSFNPQRLTHSQALTCDQNHAYGPSSRPSTAARWTSSSSSPRRPPAPVSRSSTVPPAWSWTITTATR